jgi:hypothetical protein
MSELGGELGLVEIPNPLRVGLRVALLEFPRRFASEIIPASATTVTSGRSWAVMNCSMTGSIVLVSARLPSNAETMSGNPAWSVSRPIVICGSSRRSLENPGSRNPSPWSVSKYKVDTSYRTRLAGPS